MTVDLAPRRCSFSGVWPPRLAFPGVTGSEVGVNVIRGREDFPHLPHHPPRRLRPDPVPRLSPHKSGHRAFVDLPNPKRSSTITMASAVPHRVGDTFRVKGLQAHRPLLRRAPGPRLQGSRRRRRPRGQLAHDRDLRPRGCRRGQEGRRRARVHAVARLPAGRTRVRVRASHRDRRLDRPRRGVAQGAAAGPEGNRPIVPRLGVGVGYRRRSRRASFLPHILSRRFHRRRRRVRPQNTARTRRRRQVGALLGQSFGGFCIADTSASPRNPSPRLSSPAAYPRWCTRRTPRRRRTAR